MHAVLAVLRPWPDRFHLRASRLQPVIPLSPSLHRHYYKQAGAGSGQPRLMCQFLSRGSLRRGPQSHLSGNPIANCLLNDWATGTLSRGRHSDDCQSPARAVTQGHAPSIRPGLPGERRESASHSRRRVNTHTPLPASDPAASGESGAREGEKCRPASQPEWEEGRAGRDGDRQSESGCDTSSRQSQGLKETSGLCGVVSFSL